ncbi:MAG: alpha-galactosidase [Bacteroidales bacterium]|nr:alpha-galactosidase [Bacteroidales bacterium]
MMKAPVKIKSLFLLSLLLISFLFSCSHSRQGKILLTDGWKLQSGDHPSFSSSSFDDSNWKDISPLELWDAQGYADLDGYAWYRVRVNIPSSFKTHAYFKDSLVIFLGKIDDRDQTWLNGKPLGQNGKTVSADTKFPDTIPNEGETWAVARKYMLAADDPRINWNGENVIAIRVFDRGGLGGMYGPAPYIAMRDVGDYVTFNLHREPFLISKQVNYKKIIILNNVSAKDNFDGVLSVKVINQENDRVIFSETTAIHLKAGKETKHSISFINVDTANCLLQCSFKPEKSGNVITASVGAPYILTPPPPASPRINGPRVYGARPGHPFLYRIPITGKRPVTVEVKGLPEGLKADEKTGIITGKIIRKGDYPVSITVRNAAGTDTATLLIRAGSTLALTPPMGWNSWNVWGLSVDADKVKAAADAFLSTSLADHGWSYINIDDGWEAPQRTPDGAITGNEKFCNFKDLSGYVHSKGLKLGIYSSPGPYTCGGYLGSYQHEFQDAKTWADWGIDYIKYDWCSYGKIAKDNSLEELQKPYLLMRKALDAVNRDIVYSLCQYGMGHVWEWGAKVGGNLWRTTGDITDTWNSMSGIGFRQNTASPYASPGHWNDPDMLVVGWVGWGPDIRPTRLTPDEQYTHISLWSLLSAPLLIGCDLSRMDDFTMSLLTNDEVLAVNQDPLGKQADKVYVNENIQYWTKPLADGTHAAGIFNLGKEKEKIYVRFSDLKLKGDAYEVRDLWRQKNLGTFNDRIELKIPSHGVVLLKIKQRS